MNKSFLLSVLLIMALVLLSGCDQTPQKRDGETIYNQSCISCHERGVGGAPIRGNQIQWQKRLSKGEQVLFNNLKNGYSTMPAKGACFSCSDEDLKLVLDYLLLEKRPE